MLSVCTDRKVSEQRGQMQEVDGKLPKERKERPREIEREDSTECFSIGLETRRGPATSKVRRRRLGPR